MPMGFNPLLFPMAVVFLISSMAETARAPFDLTEAESELVAGYQTEYSSMAFALYWLGEYANVILMCALNALLFWGGWLPPLDLPFLYLPYGLNIIYLLVKIWIFFFIFSWVKATVPRYRYDQLMRLGWKILPAAFAVLRVSRVRVPDADPLWRRPVIAQPLARHAGLDPASRFFFNAAPQGSWTSDPVRGDGREVFA